MVTAAAATYASKHKSILNEYERNMLFNQLELIKGNYKKSIGELKHEYDMINQHRLSLEEKLYMLEVDREIAEYVKRQKVRLSNEATKSTGLLQDLEEHYEPVRLGADKDKFSVQDRLFSKWACTMQTSVNGETWHDIPQLSYCSNCGDNTFICPHKLSANEAAVIQVPAQTTFLRFARPKLQYNRYIVTKSLDTYKRKVLRMSDEQIRQQRHHQQRDNTASGRDGLGSGDDGGDTSGSPQDGADSYPIGGRTVVLANYSQFADDEYYSSDEMREPDALSRALNEGDPGIGLVHTFQRIINDFGARTALRRQVLRPFSFVSYLFSPLFLFKSLFLCAHIK